jgi:hypothetical protein
MYTYIQTILSFMPYNSLQYCVGNLGPGLGKFGGIKLFNGIPTPSW